MTKPIYVRELTKEEEARVQAGLRSSEAFTLRRSQIVLASSRGKRASQIARELICDPDTVTNTINAFNERGLDALVKRSSATHTSKEAFDAAAREHLREIVQHSPRSFGKETSVWTLALLADVSFESGLIAKRVTGETIRATFVRMGVNWKRAKHWLTSNDPAYARKKDTETG